MSAYALALPNARPRRAARYGTRTQFACAGGTVDASFVRVEPSAASGGGYALRVENHTANEVTATIPDSPFEFSVPPFSIVESVVALPNPTAAGTAIARIEGGGGRFILEAPQHAPRHGRSRWIAGGATTVGLLISLAWGGALSIPRVGVFNPPGKALAGSSIAIPYALGGASDFRYRAVDERGKLLASGVVHSGIGAIRVRIPERAHGDVLVDLSARRFFFTAERSAVIAVTPAHRARIMRGPAAPVIRSFDLAGEARAGGTLTVRYLTDAKSGDVWLIDDAGRLWATAPLSATGTSSLAIPAAAAGRQMRVVLRAASGARDTVESLGLTMLPGALQTPAPQVKTAAIPVMQISAASAAPGDTIVVTLHNIAGDARVALTDANGATVESGDATSDQSAVSLIAPEVSAPTTYYVTAQVAEGVAQQTLVKAVTVAPRSSKS